MADLDRSEELCSNVEYGSCSTNGGTNSESGNHWIENVVKIRKPYTITKQREKWREEEHERFLEALKLYGRGWRQIEEHIGTKTAVQIRSHAQKFLSKVGREADNCSHGSDRAVVIPPPRPKRKPSHPYPRKSPVPCQTEKSPSPNLSAMERGTKSPTSVLSAFASDNPDDQLNGCSSPNSCTTDIQSIGKTSIDKENDNATSKQLLKDSNLPSQQDAAIVSAPISSITLFGKTVLVMESHRSDYDLETMISKAGPENQYMGTTKSSLWIDSRHVDTDLSLGVAMNLKAGVLETSCTGSNAHGSAIEVLDNLERSVEPITSPWHRLSSLQRQISCCSANGFRPYKRCLSEREVTSSVSVVVTSEEHENRRARVCS